MSEFNSYENLILKLHKFQNVDDTKNIIKTNFEIFNYHYNLGNFNQGKLFLDDISKLKSTQENLNYLYGLLELQNKNYNLAKKYFKEELNLYPNSNNKNKIETLLEKLNTNSNFPTTVIFITIINLIIFYIINIFSNTNYTRNKIFSNFTIDYISLIKYTISDFHISFSNLFSSIFIHYNFIHLIFNLIFLIMFGLILEKKIGTLKTFLIFISGSIIGNLMQFLIGQNDFILGSSGGVFAIIGAVMITQPLLKIRLFGFINSPIILVLSSVVFINIIFDYIFTTTNKLISNVFVQSSNISHIFGLFIGICIILLFHRNYLKYFYNWSVIIIGFSFISLFIIEILQLINKLKIFNIYDTVINLILFLVGIFLIIYSYNILKKEELEIVN